MTEELTARSPEGVWIEYPDGTRYDDLPVVFFGVTDDGITMFEVIPPRDEAPTAMGASVFPGMTGLRFPELQPGSETP